MKTIFLDMDGVVADFDLFAEGVVGRRVKQGDRYDDADWKKISKNQRFYRSLELYDHAEMFVNRVKSLATEHGYDIKFLTAIPRNNDVPWSFVDKIHWADKHFPGIPVWFGPYSSDKHHHCQPGDILVDDRPTNINDWNSVGGIGIRFTDPIFVIKELQKTLEQIKD
jgi:5'(3')-deoxyribonucleotidase